MTTNTAQCPNGCASNDGCSDCPPAGPITCSGGHTRDEVRDEVIAVIAEALWDGDADNSQPDYDRIAALYDEAVSNLYVAPKPDDEKGADS